MTVMLL